MHEWVLVAELVKPKSLQGGLVVRSAPGLSFLLREGIEVAFVPPVLDAPRRGIVIEVSELRDGVGVVAFDSVDSIDAAEALAGCSCLVRRLDLPEGFDVQDERPLVGYRVVDERLGEIGTVVEVIDNGAQQLLSVDSVQGEVLVPYVDAIVVDEDDDARTVATRLPRGLFEC